MPIRGNSRESLYRVVSILGQLHDLVKDGLTSRDHGFTGPGTRVELQAGHAWLVGAFSVALVAKATYKVYFRCSSISMMAA
jgi:hypothetical protein